MPKFTPKKIEMDRLVSVGLRAGPLRLGDHSYISHWLATVIHWVPVAVVVPPQRLGSGRGVVRERVAQRFVRRRVIQGFVRRRVVRDFVRQGVVVDGFIFDFHRNVVCDVVSLLGFIVVIVRWGPWAPNVEVCDGGARSVLDKVGECGLRHVGHVDVAIIVGAIVGWPMCRRVWGSTFVHTGVEREVAS